MPLRLLCLVALLAAACSSPTPPASRVPDRLILFSTEINPTPGETTKELFHGHVVLGKIEITDPEQRAEVWNAVHAATSKESKGAKCFMPRHGLREVYGDKELDHHFCFTCFNRYEFWGGRRSPEYGISRRPKDLLNRILTEANIPIAPEHGKE